MGRVQYATFGNLAACKKYKPLYIVRPSTCQTNALFNHLLTSRVAANQLVTVHMLYWCDVCADAGIMNRSLLDLIPKMAPHRIVIHHNMNTSASS